jgi:hypothetical protein
MKAALRLLPLLVLYVLLASAYIAQRPELRIDEGRYVAAAQQLVRVDSVPTDRIQIWSGPGYPILLAPFAKLDLPWAAARLFNAVLMFLAIVYFNRMLNVYVGTKAALIGTYVLGLYPPLLAILPRLMTEPTAILLVCGFMFHFAAASRRGRGFAVDLILASAYLGYLALTKVLFGYVIALCLAIFLARLVLARRRKDLKSLAVCGVALLVCVPYLSFTHKLTGKTFYWANSGGLSLYWMSTPFEREYGDWLAPTKPWLRTPAGSDRVGRGDKHREFLDRMDRLGPFERDDSLRAQAARNIRSNPGKFAQNLSANLGRLFFDYPFSYRPQTGITYLSMLPGMFLAVAIVLSIYPTIRARHRIPYELGALECFMLAYLGGSTVLSGYNRMLLPIVPLLVMWVTFAFARLVRIEIAGGSLAGGES